MLQCRQLNAPLSHYSVKKPKAQQKTQLRFPVELSLLTIWLSGNTLASINEVPLRRARLVLGWVAVLRRVKRLRAEPATPDLLSLVIPLWVGAMSISESWKGVRMHTTRCNSPYPWSRGVSWCLAER